MARKLTKKQEGFVRDYVMLGNGTKAALNNYTIKRYETAHVIASENLLKPTIIKAIEGEKKRIGDLIPDDVVKEKHLQLLNQKQVSYFVFPKKMNEEEIRDKVTAAGLEVIVIKDGEKGQYAFYSLPDANAIKSGVDMAYKLKGEYAPEKTQSVNINVDVKNPAARKIAKEFEEKLKLELKKAQ